ncbi:uncharacterized protein LOC113642200 [Tachysurus ichikawai]
MERQQQQQQQQPEQRKQTKTCLACGQPKSRYENDGSSVHFFLSTRPCQILLLLYKERTCIHKETGGEETAKAEEA